MWFHYKKIKVCTHTFPLVYKEKQNLDAGENGDHIWKDR